VQTLIAPSITIKTHFDPQQCELTIDEYFQKNSNKLNRELSDSHHFRLNPDLSIYDVQAELMLRLNSKVTDKFSHATIENLFQSILKGKCLDENDKDYSRRHVSASNIGSKEGGGTFLLHQESREPIDPEDLASRRRHNKAKVVILANENQKVIIPKYSGLTQDKSKWQTLSWQQYQVISYLLSGLSVSETARSLEMNVDSVTNSAYKARKKLDLSLEKLREISVKNSGSKKRKDPLYGKKLFYKFLYSKETDDKQVLNRLKLDFERIRSRLSKDAQLFLSYIEDGLSIQEIMQETGFNRNKICCASRYARERVLKLLETRLEPSPKDIEIELWNKLGIPARKVFRDYIVNGLSVDDIVTKYQFKSDQVFYTRMKDTRRVLKITLEQMMLLRDVYTIQNTGDEVLRKRALDLVFGDRITIEGLDEKVI